MRNSYEHCLTGIPHTNVPGWLATLGAFGICSEDEATLHWEERGGVPVPVLACSLDEPALVARIRDAFDQLNSAFKATGDQSSPWKKLRLSGKCATRLVHSTPLSVRRTTVVDDLPALFCCKVNSSEVRLTELFGGVTAQVRVGRIAETLCNAVVGSDGSDTHIWSTLFGPWQPMEGGLGKSLGLDWATVSDKSRADGSPRSFPARDLLALLGATWAPRSPRQHLLVWPAWKERLAPDDIATLLTRPELQMVGTSWRARSGSTPSRAALDAQRTLQTWSVTHIMVSRSVRRTTHRNSSYRVWEEAEAIDLRALR